MEGSNGDTEGVESDQVEEGSSSGGAVTSADGEPELDGVEENVCAPGISIDTVREFRIDRNEMQCFLVQEDTCEMPDTPELKIETQVVGEVGLQLCCESFNTSTMFMFQRGECRMIIFSTCTLADDGDPLTDETVVKMDD